jgi:hypothetical protein
MSLYGLKHSGCKWYNHLNEYLLREGYNNDHICLYVLIKKLESDFVIIVMYVDDLCRGVRVSAEALVVPPV